MAIDPAAPRSRRALLAASIGGLAAVAAQALGRPLTANAADGATVTVGNEALTGSSVTKITTTGDAAFWGASPDNIGIYGSSSTTDGVVGEGPGGVHGYGSAYGVYGQVSGGGVGVQGQSTSSGWGVLGISSTSVGTRGQSTSGPGVQGLSSTGPGVLGKSGAGPAVLATNESSGPGVVGTSGNIEDAPTPAPAKTGVYGISTIDANSRGVWGQSSSGQGVRGVATTGRGVHGEATSGIGVRAYATIGTGLLSEATTGFALRTVGRVRFDKSIGLASIPAGSSGVVVTPGIDLTATSAVVATLQGNAGGSTTVKRVAVNVTNNTFTVYLTANSTAAVKVAWHVFG